ncbi:hypothetical protein A2U01_0114323, partial [Trifolium medium]|nr:hypothetical protein [Trifolium medium]
DEQVLLGLEPVLDLSLEVGEGSGCVAGAVSMIGSSERVFSESEL